MLSQRVGVFIHRARVAAAAHAFIPGIDTANLVGHERRIAPLNAPENHLGRGCRNNRSTVVEQVGIKKDRSYRLIRICNRHLACGRGSCTGAGPATKQPALHAISGRQRNYSSLWKAGVAGGWAINSRRAAGHASLAADAD